METAPPPSATVPPFRQPKVIIRWAAFLLALLGWALSGVLLLSAANATFGGALMDAVCGGAAQADAGWDCRSVLSSRWGYWPQEGGLRIPVSALGMAYFAFVGLWYLFIGPTTANRSAYHLIIAAMIVCGVCESARFVWIMAQELHQWCAMCLTVHGANAGLLLLTIAAWPWRAVRAPARSHPSGRLALATVTAALLAAFAHLAVVLIYIQGGQLQQVGRAYREIVDDPAYAQWNFNRQPIVDLALSGDEPILGTPDAPNTVVVFSDLCCTQCRTAHELLAKVRAMYPDDIRVIPRYFPQDSACNPLETFHKAGHAGACRAAQACEAARLVGGSAALESLRQRLYERQGQIDSTPATEQAIADWAVELGLDRDAFTAALDDSTTGGQIAADIAAGLDLGISSVPVVYLNNRRLIGWSKLATWEALLGPPATTTSAAAEPPAATDSAAAPQP